MARLREDEFAAHTTTILAGAGVGVGAAN
ncbi:MAG: hypothetical protein QOF73_405, partial [Thermomicrobiales bacterium]|nr:hypothetical protein [Thermomicrobiales bacterium]